MKEIKITNLVKLYTLLLLSKKPNHGYEIIKKVGKNIGKKVSAGETYPFLKNLKRHGLIATKKSGIREKKVYSLTNSGRVFVKRMLERFESLIDIAIEPKLTSCSHCGCKIYEGGYRKGKLVFCCQECAKS